MPDSTKQPPPAVIASARVLAYAFVDDIAYRKWGRLYAGDKLIKKVPRLAICSNLGKDIGLLLFHCDEHWNVLGTSGAPTVEEVKEQAERNYPGVSSRWIDANVTIEEALKFYGEDTDGLKCSFCGKRPFEVTAMVTGAGKAICKQCVEEFHEALQETDGEDAST